MGAEQREMAMRACLKETRMATHLYLLMTPEALVASMLPPADFGTYIATGTRKRSRGEAFFFEVAEGFESRDFELSEAEKRCVPHKDGMPKHSVYLSIYRVLEHVPRGALGSLWLITRDGRHLELTPAESPETAEVSYHLYKELCPDHPLIASTLAPGEFGAFITDSARLISIPRICFVDLDLAGLAHDPAEGDAGSLPYGRIDHLRDCLMQLRDQPDKRTKTVDRIPGFEFPYRCVRTGFYLCDRDGTTHYPFPSETELDEKHHEWWRSANA